MLRQRVLVTVVLLPVGLWIFALGGWLFAVAMAGVLARSAREYAGLFQRGGLRPSAVLLVAGAAALVLARQARGFDGSAALLAVLALAAMTWHVVDFERGAPHSGTDFAVTLGGVCYLGLVGAYLVSLRSLPDGVWWLLIRLPAVWIGDSAGYFVGRAHGRHKMAPRLSPKKSWEGYAAGVVGAALAGAPIGLIRGCGRGFWGTTWRSCWPSEAGPDGLRLPGGSVRMSLRSVRPSPVRPLASSTFHRDLAFD